MLGAVPTVPVVKDLVLARTAFELYHENGLHFRAFASSRSGIHGFNADALGKQIELRHAGKN